MIVTDKQAYLPREQKHHSILIQLVRPKKDGRERNNKRRCLYTLSRMAVILPRTTMYN